MKTLREAAQRALKSLEDAIKMWTEEMEFRSSIDAADEWLESYAALREALAQPEQEPVAWMDRDGDIYPMPETEGWRPPHKLLYTHPPQHQEANPVVWQFRMRPDWVRDKDFWEPWTNCTKEQAANYQRVPHLHDWTYESRSLFTHPPQRKPLTNEELDALAIDEDGLPNSHFEFARAIERAHGIGEKE